MANKTAKINAWERQQGESSQAYEAFAAYRDMGAERSITRVVQELNKSRALIGRWSKAWNWVERAREWDNELDRRAKAEAVKKYKDMTNRHVNLAMQLQKKAVEALEVLDLGELSPKEILAFIEKAAALERLNRTEQAGLSPDGNDKSGGAGPSRSLADTILAAYSRRKEGGDDA